MGQITGLGRFGKAIVRHEEPGAAGIVKGRLEAEAVRLPRQTETVEEIAEIAAGGQGGGGEDDGLDLMVQGLSQVIGDVDGEAVRATVLSRRSHQ